MSVAPTITYLSDIYFEPGIAAQVPNVLARFKIARPLLVTDSGIANAGLVGRLAIRPVATFQDIQTNPSESGVLAGLAMYRNSGCDGIVAFGGGSPMDCAKAIAVLVHHPAPLEQYALINGGLPRITRNRPPLVCIPTTAGTGSEVGRGALITFNSGQKLALISPHLIPEAAVCDPQLTLGLPPMLTAATGMDAISHCVETFCSPRFNPVADAIAMDGLVRACTNIENATKNGQDLSARSEMMIAALQGGLTFQKGLGAIHALSHPLGSIEHRRLHHGALNAILLPHVLRFNMSACREKVNRMAGLLGRSDGENLPRLFEDLSSKLGLPCRLSELGVTREEVLSQVDAAFRDHCRATNPREMSAGDCRMLLEAAY